MKKYFEQLSPQERRWVVGIGLVVFVILNLWFVKPHFGDWDRADARMEKAETTIAMFRKEIARKPVYERKVKELRDDGTDVPPEDQIIDLDRNLRNKAAENGVTIVANSRPQTFTNQFFLDQEIGLNLQSGEKQLVNYLYSLGAGNSTVRVRGMALRPDPNHQQLNVNVTVVASYQKKATARTAPATAPAKPTTPAPDKTKPATPGPVGTLDGKIIPAANRPMPPGMGSKLNAATNKPAPLNR